MNITWEKIKTESENIDVMIDVIVALDKYKDEQHYEKISKAVFVIRQKIANLHKLVIEFKLNLENKPDSLTIVKILEEKFNTKLL